MKLIKLLPGILAIAAVLLVPAGCERDLKLETGDAVFKVLNEDGTPVTTQQIFDFNASSKFKLEMKNVAGTDITTPMGWGCETSVVQRTVTITSPDPANTSALLEGNVTITAKGVNGSTEVVKISVKAVEADIVLECTSPEITDPVVFRLEQEKTFTFKASANIVSYELSATPKGWTITPDWTAPNLKIKAPADIDNDPALSGTVTVTPKTGRGTEGAPVVIEIKLDNSAPVLELDKSEIWFTPGDVQTATITKSINVKKVDTDNIEAPEGWIVTPDIGNDKITVTAPATVSAGNERGGKVVIPIVSTADIEADVEIHVMRGICDMADMLAFGDAVAEGTELNGKFAIAGEVRLMADIDLSTADRDVIAGAADKPFSGFFNGSEKKITLSIAAAGADAGLFHTLGAGASVKNLTLEGAIASSAANANIGGVAIYNDGAELNGISSSVTMTYTGGVNGGHYGGIVAASRVSGAKYIDCHTSGDIATNGIKFFGGLVGYIAPGTEGSMTDCSNSGDITLDYGTLNMTDAQAGGCVGATTKTKWTFTRVSNTGDIDYNFGKAGSVIYGLGGAFGTAAGTFTNCFNTGNVIDTDGDDAVSAGERCIGGFAGQTRSVFAADDPLKGNDYPIIATGCYNTGNVVGISNVIGGFIGGLRNGSATAQNQLTDCRNEGNVRVVSKAIVSDKPVVSGMFGGFAALSYQYTTLTRCKNSGKVIGNTNRSAGGLIGAGADNLIIDQCENSGMVYIGAFSTLNARTGRPFVGGLAALRGTNPVTIKNSKNTGSITAATFELSHVQSVYAHERITYDLDEIDKTVCDEATKTASAGATIKYIPRDQWDSMTLPDM